MNRTRLLAAISAVVAGLLTLGACASGATTSASGPSPSVAVSVLM